MAIAKQGHRFGVKQDSLGHKFCLPGELLGYVDNDLFDAAAGWNDSASNGTVTTDTPTYTKTITRVSDNGTFNGFTRSTGTRLKRGTRIAIDFRFQQNHNAIASGVAAQFRLGLAPNSTGSYSNTSGLAAGIPQMNNGFIGSAPNDDGPLNDRSNTGLSYVIKGAVSSPGTIQRSIQPNTDYYLIFELNEDDTVSLYIEGGDYTEPALIATSHLDLFGAANGSDLRLAYNVAHSGV